MTEKTSTAGMTMTALTESITGYDEIAVEKHFEMDLYSETNKNRPMMLTRAFIFVHRLHEGDNHTDARKFALSMPTREIDAYFDDEPDDAMPDEPDSDEGKDDSEDERPPSA